MFNNNCKHLVVKTDRRLVRTRAIDIFLFVSATGTGQRLRNNVLTEYIGTRLVSYEIENQSNPVGYS